jgi:hypothetical protein
MPVNIKEVNGKQGLKHFIKFQMQLYKGVTQYVPPIIDFELSTLSPEKNPAFEIAQAKYWLAYRGEDIVGRVAGICLEAELKEKALVRFGWIDFMDDIEVSTALLDKVSKWGKELGAEQLHGPLGFTDLDFEGTLIEGFDHLATQATIYNFPYYQRHFEAYGMKKAVDWIEMRGWVPDSIPRKLTRTASIVKSRFGFQMKRFRKKKELLQYAPQIFELLNRSYQNLYGYFQLTEKQIDYYIEQYLGFVRLEFVGIILNKDGKVIGTGIGFPSFSRAFQQAKGRLFPFGFIPILRSFFSNRHLDLFLIGVDPDYQKMGANVILFADMFETYQKKGVKYLSSGPMLENNQAVLSLWNEFSAQVDPVNIRRRCYIGPIA